MSRSGATSSRLETARGFVNGSAGPWTIAFWFRSLNTGQTQKYLYQERVALSSGQTAVIYEYVNDQIEFFSANYTGTNPRTNSGITISDTNWHHVAYRKDASGTSAYDKFLDGTKTSINAAIAFTLPNENSSCLFAANNNANPVDAEMAWWGWWNTAQSDEAIAAMAAGAHPARFSDGLLEVLEMSGISDTDEKGLLGSVWAETGTIGVASSPHVTLGRPRTYFIPAAAAGGGFQAAWARNRSGIIGAGLHA